MDCVHLNFDKFQHLASFVVTQPVHLLDRGDRVIVGPLVGEHDQSRELSVSIFDPILSFCMVGTSSRNTAGGNHDLAAVRDTANFRFATDAQEALPKTGR